MREEVGVDEGREFGWIRGGGCGGSGEGVEVDEGKEWGEMGGNWARIDDTKTRSRNTKYIIV